MPRLTIFASLSILLLTLSLTARSADEPKALAADGAARAASKEIVHLEDVVYGQVHGAGLLADIAYPQSSGLRPAIISVHGGRWTRGNRRDSSAIKVDQWAGFGFFAMAIDYRLTGCTPVPACYQDVQCAIRFVHANAEKYKIDPKQVFLIGQSAGGHMVSLAATLGDGPYPRTGGWEKASNDVKAVISVAGNYDLLGKDCWGDLWKPNGVESEEARKLASPIQHVKKSMPPILIFHSDNDKSVPIAIGLRMVETLKNAGASHVFHHYPTMGHMGINDEVITKSLEFIKALPDAPRLD
ncbi:alpha/beta hydrolase fold domain-containing protein [Singulisphaera rosea]